ncbi:MAG: polysaccharide biosynthesis/export family protein [Akkermansiaceae bacterium]
MKLLFLSSLFFTTVLCATVVDSVKVEKGDTLVIAIRGVPPEDQAQINGNYQVNSKGELYLPYISKSPIKAEGLSAGIIAKNIERIYQEAEIYTAAAISVTKQIVRKTSCGPGCGHVSKRYLTVSGQVDRAGPQVYGPGFTLFHVVSLARPKAVVALNRVELLRHGKVYKYDMKIEAHKNERVYPMDQITLRTKRVIGK